jgi:hypothetical protein
MHLTIPRHATATTQASRTRDHFVLMFRSEIVGANFFFRRFEALIQSAIGENQFGVFFRVSLGS